MLNYDDPLWAPLKSLFDEKVLLLCFDFLSFVITFVFFLYFLLYFL